MEHTETCASRHLGLIRYGTAILAGFCAAYFMYRNFNRPKKHLRDSSTDPCLARADDPEHDAAGVMRMLLEPEFEEDADAKTVYITLKGSRLVIYEANERVPTKELFDEQPLELTFKSRAVFNIFQSEVEIQQRFHTKKWHMKYPIVININGDSLIEENYFGHPTKSLRGQEQLFLFARSNRDNEAWTMWLTKATRKNNFYNCEDNPILSIRAGRPLVEPRPVYIERRTKSVWLNKLMECIFSHNAILNLIKSTMTNQAQDLLEEMRVQGYFNSILRVSVDRVDLSRMSVPRVIGVAPPYENEYGLWEEVNVRYNGVISVTLKIELNAQEMLEADVESFWLDQLQQLARYPFFKRILESTAFFVIVSLDSLRGVLALNVPHPPTDTAWVGFRSNTKISVSGKVYWGAWPVPFFHDTIDSLTNFIVQSFHKHFLIPNMMQIGVPPFFN